MHEGSWYAVGAGITRPRAHDMRPYKGKEGSRPVCKGDAKKHSRPTGDFAAKFGNLLQVEESVHTGILGHVAQFPIACDARNGDPDDLKCSGEVNSPCAKVFACGENACTAQSAAPSSSQSPLCSVSACGKNFAALPCSSSPQTTHCVGLVWGSPRWGPEELGDGKSKAAQMGGFAEMN